MTKKELVVQMFETALDWYVTGTVSEYFMPSLKEVITSMAKHEVYTSSLSENEDADWDKLVYQIIYDLEFAWWLNLGYRESAAIGCKQLSEELVKQANLEGYEFIHSTLSKERYYDLVEELGLKEPDMTLKVTLTETYEGLSLSIDRVEL